MTALAYEGDLVFIFLFLQHFFFIKMHQENNKTEKIQDQDNKTIKKRETIKETNLDRGVIKDYNHLTAKTAEEIAILRERGRSLFSKKKIYKRPTRTTRPPPPIPNEKKSEDQLKMERIQRLKDIRDYQDAITYSSKYYDDEYEYRHVILPKEIARWLPHYGLLKEDEWRALGVNQSIGWVHYMVHGNK